MIRKAGGSLRGVVQRLTLAALALTLWSCTSKPPEPEIAEGDLSDWRDAFVRSCGVQPWQGQIPPIVATWQAACRSAEDGATIDLDWVSRYFVREPMAEEALVTGYFEPTLRASRARAPGYQVPLYRKPPAALEKRARAEIDAGALAGRGLELAWLADPVDAFFLHIQGSGNLVFADGERLRVGYAGNNGHEYRAIGRDLIADGAIAREDISMQSIATWLRAHPAAAPAMMQRNPRYIYFRPLPDAPGPIGAQGIALTPERSLAVDPIHISYGLPVWIDVEHPDPKAQGRLRRLMVAQDTGAAIKGRGRADFFWGAGGRAAALAGRMKAKGRLYVLVPRIAAGS